MVNTKLGGAANAPLTAARRAIAGAGLDGLLVTQPHNRRYLSGVMATEGSAMASAGWLILTPSDAVFVTSFLYLEAAEKQAQEVNVVRAPVKISETAVELLRERDVRRLGFEAGHLVVAIHDELKGALDGTELVPVDGLIEDLRAVKSPEETERIRRSAKLTDEAYAHFLAIARPEMTESEAAWEIERYLREHGADGMAFDPSVAAGPHAAVPHHDPTDTPLGVGRPVWVDLGARVDGYCSDLTRSFCFGRADERFREVWELTLKAQETALRGIRAGVTGKDADALARDVIAAGGHGDAFGHSLGHGLGLAIHERPRASRISPDTLAAGMVVTVEPGIYYPGWGGVRIEDLVVVMEDGIDVLSAAPKSLTI